MGRGAGHGDPVLLRRKTYPEARELDVVRSARPRAMGWDALAFVPFVAFANFNMLSVISCTTALDPVPLAAVCLDLRGLATAVA